MKQSLYRLVLLGFVGFCVRPADAARNIVFIVADDLGWNDVGFRNPTLITPNIDRLARGGVILNTSYVQPTCTPSRHAFMTGNYPFKAGIQRAALTPWSKECSPLGVHFLPEHLKEQNYATHIIGKWHLGYCNWNCTPTYRGFDTFYGSYNGREDYYTKDIFNGTDLRDGVERAMSDTYSAELYSSRAVDIINQHDKSRGLFLYLPYQSVHVPLEVPKKYEDMYPNIKNDQRRTYCGMVTAMDEGIGNITTALENAGLMNDTLIIFTTDNGGMVTEGGNNFPLRGSKTTIFEGGTRATAFVYGAGLQKTGYTYNGMMHAVDWNPTIMAAAGVQVPTDIDGINQWDAIRTNGQSNRTEFIYNLDTDRSPTGHAAIRVGDFKLIQGYPGKLPGWYELPVDNKSDIPSFQTHPDIDFGEKLFNLRKDPTERKDVKDEFPEVVRQLRRKLDEYRKELVTPKMIQEFAGDASNFGGYWSPGWC